MADVAPDGSFDGLLEYIETELGFATSVYNDDYLDRRITARLRRSDTDGYVSYRELLADDVAEQLEPIGDYGAYVERDGDALRVRDRMRDAVTFRRRDLVTDGPPGTFDLAICRNLFIYIDADAKRTVCETLESALAADGYLTIGVTETVPPSCRSRFDPVAKRLRIYRKAGATDP